MVIIISPGGSRELSQHSYPVMLCLKMELSYIIHYVNMMVQCYNFPPIILYIHTPAPSYTIYKEVLSNAIIFPPINMHILHTLGSRITSQL